MATDRPATDVGLSGRSPTDDPRLHELSAALAVEDVLHRFGTAAAGSKASVWYCTCLFTIPNFSGTVDLTGRPVIGFVIAVERPERKAPRLRARQKSQPTTETDQRSFVRTA